MCKACAKVFWDKTQDSWNNFERQNFIRWKENIWWSQADKESHKHCAKLLWHGNMPKQ